jgi:AraC-like DNA-binding protein
MDYLVQRSASLREAMQHGARFARVVHDGGTVRIEDAPGIAVVVLDRPDGVPRSNAMNTWALGCIVDLARAMHGDADIRFADVPAEAPADTTPYVRAFGANVRFGASRYAVAFGVEQFDAPSRRADPRLVGLLRAQVERALDALPRAGRLRDRVLSLVSTEPFRDRPRASEVAKQLALSDRTLRRRLADEGTTLNAILDDARRDRAMRDVLDPSLTLEAVAADLGFRDVSGLHRAFRRWTGTSPSEWRRRELVARVPTPGRGRNV